MITKEQIEEKIRSLGWDVNGTAETNDMILLAEWALSQPSDLIEAIKGLRDEYDKRYLMATNTSAKRHYGEFHLKLTKIINKTEEK